MTQEPRKPLDHVAAFQAFARTIKGGEGRALKAEARGSRAAKFERTAKRKGHS